MRERIEQRDSRVLAQHRNCYHEHLSCGPGNVFCFYMPEYGYLEGRVAANTERDNTERTMNRTLEGKRSMDRYQQCWYI